MYLSLIKEVNMSEILIIIVVPALLMTLFTAYLCGATVRKRRMVKLRSYSRKAMPGRKIGFKPGEL